MVFLIKSIFVAKAVSALIKNIWLLVNIYWITWKEIPEYIKSIFHKTHQLPTPPTTPGEETSEIGTVFSFPHVGRLRPGEGPRQAESRAWASLVVMVTHSGPPHKKSTTCPGSPFRANSDWGALSGGSALPSFPHPLWLFSLHRRAARKS